ncbi:MAG TPA: RNA polymerase sigma factor [Pirellulales bacterium]
MADAESSDAVLNAWVSTSAARALGYARTLVRNREAAEDLVQDCYRRLLARADVYDLPRDGTKLLFRSITNACINWTQRRVAEASLDHLLRTGGSTAPRALSDRDAVEPIEIVIERELSVAVDAAMQRLPVEQRAAVELRSLGYALLDVAAALNVSHGHARVLLHRARTTLAEQLKPYLEESAP